MTIINELKITALTCTGDRPVCFSLLEKWMAAQTIKPFQWLVIDDGKTPTTINSECDYVRRIPKPTDPKQTLNLNIKTALPLIEGEVVIFIEDDEYYAPRYLQVMGYHLISYEVVGICRSRYYHLPSFRYYCHGNLDHASLAQTGVRRSFLKEMPSLLTGDPFIDIRIWKKVSDKKELLWGSVKNFNVSGQPINGNKGFLFDDAYNKRYLYVGMKGMPGRYGIGSGHAGIGTLDNHQQILKEWIPKDYEEYVKLGMEINNQLNSKQVVKVARGGRR